jgi:uncharacterized protein YndB with AHSA1/START domain
MSSGTYISVGGRPAVRFEREYRHALERVWRAVSEADQARQWFPSALTFEPRVGGAVRFTGDPNMSDGEGVVLEYEPPRLLAFTWGDGEVRIALEPVGEDRCRFVLINVLGADNEAARNAAGWAVCLGELDKVAQGEQTQGPHAVPVPVWQAAYESYVRSGMPAGAPVPD